MFLSYIVPILFDVKHLMLSWIQAYCRLQRVSHLLIVSSNIISEMNPVCEYMWMTP